MYGGGWIGGEESIATKKHKRHKKMDEILRCAQNDILILDSCLRRNDIMSDVRDGVADL